jgi:hypothetical protein
MLHVTIGLCASAEGETMVPSGEFWRDLGEHETPRDKEQVSIGSICSHILGETDGKLC